MQFFVTIKILTVLFGLLPLITAERKPQPRNLRPVPIPNPLPPLQCSDFACTLQIQPVCGYNGKCFQEFGNACQMGIENCWRGNIDPFKQISNTMCSKCYVPVCPICPEICTKNRNPVCGWNGYCYKTFSNYCLLRAQNCYISSTALFYPQNLGNCEGDSQHIPLCACPEVCPDVMDPVCGYNGDCYGQFKNTCEMEVYNCKNSDDYDVAYPGLCGPDIPVCI